MVKLRLTLLLCLLPVIAPAWSEDDTPDLFIESALTPHDPYVQQQVGYEIRVYRRSHLLQGNLHAAARWADATRFNPGDIPHLWDEFGYLQYVRLLLVQRRLDDAERLLETMHRTANGGRRHRKLITIYLLQALLHHKAGRVQRAVTAVSR